MNECLKSLLKIEREDDCPEIISKMRAQILNVSSDNLVDRIRHIIFENEGFSYSKSNPNFFDFLREKNGDCLDFTLLYQVLFDSLNIKSQIIAVPFHTILKTYIKEKEFLIEATDGSIESPEFYIKTRNIHISSIKQKVYLAALNKDQILAIYTNRKARQPLIYQNYQKAMGILKEANNFSIDIPEVCYNLGYVYKYLGNIQKAKTLFRRAIKLHPNFAKSYNELGICYTKENLLKEAEVCFKTSFSLDNTIEAEANLITLRKYLALV
ncbi:MAG: tetratricopeptide repeat protein [Nanoarchaeota archaeon]|nr:tetratricopeptide repeat protein [Nanoarchaeota archaeon]